MKCEPTNQTVCPDCGAVLLEDAPRGQCLNCLFKLGAPELASGGGQSLEEAATIAAPTNLAASGSAYELRLTDQVPTRIADYELIEEIARGGMGIVHKARQVSLDRIVAVKMLLFGARSSHETVQRFRVEASAAASLQHPHIVAIYEVGFADGQHFFAMEYVAGRSLAAIVKDGPLPVKRAATYLKTIAGAIHYAHEQGILHRDLKPSNVLIDPFDQPKVTDFGLAKRLETEIELTLSGQLLGSPNYMPPEQAAAKRGAVGKRSDVYSLGAILYHLLTGRPPFVAPTVAETLHEVLNTEPVSPRVLNPGVPPDLETICLKCLEKEPAKRYQTAADLAEELNHFLRDEPIEARPVTRTERAWRWCRSKPALAASFLSILLLLLTVSIGSSIAAIRIAAANKAQEREAYYANIRLSDMNVREGNTDRALDLLLQCPAEYRNWEWGRLIHQCHQAILTIPAHTNNPTLYAAYESHVNWLTFTAHGSRMISQGTDGTIKVWNANDGDPRPLFSFGGGTNWVTSHGRDRDDRRLAVGCTNGIARVFDTQTWLELPAVTHGTNPVRWASLSADGHKLVTGGDDGVAQIWNVDSGERLRRFAFTGQQLRVVHFTPEDDKLVTKQANTVVTWDAASGAELSRIEPKERSLLPGVARSPSEGESPSQIIASSENWAGTLLVTFDADSHAKLWRADGTSAELGVVKGEQLGQLRWAVFSENDQLICTGGQFGFARVWDVRTGREVFSIPDRVYRAQFSRDGTRLVTVGSDKVARIWDVKEGREYLTLHGHASIVDFATFSPDGRLAATAGLNGVVKTWSATTGREVLRNDSWVWGLCYSSDGRRVASASWGLDMRVWDSESGEELLRFRPDIEGTFAAQVTPDDRLIATGGAEGIARLWDSVAGRLIREFKGHTQSIITVSISPDGKRLATDSRDTTARIWDVETGRAVHVFKGGSNTWIRAALFSPDGSKLITARSDEIGNVWDTTTGQLLFNLDSSGSPIGTLGFTPDGKRIFSTGAQSDLRIWDATTGKLLDTWPLRSPSAWNVDFLVDDTRLLTSIAENSGYGLDVPKAQVWDVPHGREVFNLRGHTEPVWNTYFLPGGRRILTSSADKTTRQWETFPWREAEYPGSPNQPLRERIAAYAQTYWRDRLRAELAAARKPAPPPVQPYIHWDRARWPQRDGRVGPNQINLLDFYTTPLETAIHAHVGTYDNNLRELPAGTITLSNITFDVRGVIGLRRTESRSGNRFAACMCCMPWAGLIGTNPRCRKALQSAAMC